MAKTKKKKIRNTFYWWYYHGNEEAVNEIQPVLDARDWEKFKKLQKKWNKDGVIYLPNECMITYDNMEEEFGAKLTKECFSKMIDNEYEYGWPQ